MQVRQNDPRMNVFDVTRVMNDYGIKFEPSIYLFIYYYFNLFISFVSLNSTKLRSSGLQRDPRSVLPNDCGLETWKVQELHGPRAL